MPEVYRLKSAIDAGCVKGLVQLFREHRIDAVHSHEFTMGVYGVAAARILGLPHLITMHGGLTVCKALRRRIALRWAMRASDHSVMVSRATQTQFATELGVDPALFTVVPNGVPIVEGDASGVRAEFGVREGECVIVAVGVLERHKGHRFLLEALARLDAESLRKPWRLIIAGGAGGEEHASLRQFIADHGLTDRVHIALNRNDVSDLLTLSDIFVMPSLWEGLPMAVLEAMVAGKAIIASRIAGIPEAVVDGQDGLLVPPGETAPLVAALRLLIENPSRRASLGAKAQERAFREFTVQVMADRYEELYQSALTGRHRAGRRVASA